MLAGLPFFQRVVEYQQRFGHAGQSVSNGVQTNAALIDDEWARFFADYRFLLGVSLDGPRQWHDHYRLRPDGQGTYEQVMRGIAALRRQEVEFNILTVVNNVTADHPDEILKFMLEQGFRYLQFIPCVELDPRTGKQADFSVSPGQFGDFLCRTFDLWYNHGQPEVSVRLFDNLLLAYAGHGPQVCQFQQECGDYVVVEYNGDVYPCDFYVETRFHLGSIHQQPLQEIAAGAAAIAFRQRKRQGDPLCHTCSWQPICNHDCPSMRDHNAEGPTHCLCQAYRQFYAYSEGRLRQMSQRIPPPPTMAASTGPVPGRNDACPCGSGKKWKKCCGRRL